MAKKDMGLSKVKYFDPKRVKKIAQDHVTKMYDRVFQKGLDKDGKQLPEYSESYRKLIKRGFKTKSGRNVKVTRGIGGIPGGKISKRMPVVRGLTGAALRAISWHKDYYEIGWNKSEPASIAKWLEEQGRDFVNDIPDKEFEWVLKQYGIVVDKEWKTKIKSQTIVVGK